MMNTNSSIILGLEVFGFLMKVMIILIIDVFRNSVVRTLLVKK